MVKTGRPYGRRNVLSPAVMRTVLHGSIIPDESVKRLRSFAKTANTIIMVKIE